MRSRRTLSQKLRATIKAKYPQAYHDMLRVIGHQLLLLVGHISQRTTSPNQLLHKRTLYIDNDAEYLLSIKGTKITIYHRSPNGTQRTICTCTDYQYADVTFNPLYASHIVHLLLQGVPPSPHISAVCKRFAHCRYIILRSYFPDVVHTHVPILTDEGFAKAQNNMAAKVQQWAINIMGVIQNNMLVHDTNISYYDTQAAYVAKDHAPSYTMWYATETETVVIMQRDEPSERYGIPIAIVPLDKTKRANINIADRTDGAVSAAIATITSVVNEHLDPSHRISIPAAT